MADSLRIEELRAAARHSRQRYQLYRAKVYGPRPTTMTRLRELERVYRGAEARLIRAERRLGAPPRMATPDRRAPGSPTRSAPQPAAPREVGKRPG
jgi:hypothetical protein